MLPTPPNGVPQPSEPQLTDRTPAPRGVVQKNLKILLYLAAVAVLILATLVSSFKKKPAVTNQTQGPPTAPAVQANTASNVATLKAQLDAERQRQQPPTPVGTQAQQAAAMSYGPDGLPVTAATPCVPGQSCTASLAGQQGGGPQPQLSPEQQETQQLAAKERERLYTSRFASNIAYSRQEGQQQQGSAQPDQGQPSNLMQARAIGDPPAQAPKRPAEVNIDAATGQPYVIYEGLTLDTVIMNRLDGDAAGPVKVLVSNPVYSHDHQHVLIPEGTIVLGEARKIGATGFGQQRRLAVVFHRMLMPDGYSVDLDQFHGLDQIGEEGLKDKVNNHYLQIFGTSIALGVISGAAQITQGGTGYNSTGSQQFVNGASAGISQQATTVLDRFIQIPPTITIREGHRVKVYFTQDMLLPAYTNHTMPQSF
jgi:type IV secretory pathway VirB10-like protein